MDLGVDHVIRPRRRRGGTGTRARERRSGRALDTVSYSPEEFESTRRRSPTEGAPPPPPRAAGEGPGRHNIGGSTEGGALERLARAPRRRCPARADPADLSAGGGRRPHSPTSSRSTRRASWPSRLRRSTPPLPPYLSLPHGHPAKGRGEDGGTTARRDGAPEAEQQAAVDEDLDRYIAPVVGPDDERRHHRLRDRDQAPLRGGRRRARAAGAPRRAGRLPLHPRHPPGHVPRPALDDAPVRRLRQPRGHQRALPLPDRARLDRALDGLRPADPARPRLGRPALRAARSAAPASRSTRSRTCGSASTRSRSPRSRPR